MGVPGADAALIRTQLRAQHNAHDGYFGSGAPASLEREEIVVASFAPGAVVAEVARQFDVSTSLIYKWRRDAQQPVGTMFVPAMMAEDDGSVPDVSRDSRTHRT